MRAVKTRQRRKVERAVALGAIAVAMVMALTSCQATGTYTNERTIVTSFDTGDTLIHLRQPTMDHFRSLAEGCADDFCFDAKLQQLPWDTFMASNTPAYDKLIWIVYLKQQGGFPIFPKLAGSGCLNILYLKEGIPSQLGPIINWFISIVPCR